MTPAKTASLRRTVRVDYEELLDFAAAIFLARGLPAERARTAAAAVCYSDLAGLGTHGLVNLTRLYLPLFDDARVDPLAELRVVTDRGAAVLVDAQRALGLWAASEAMDMAVDRAARYGVGVVSVRAASHFACAGHHALRAVRHGMIGIVASNCGRQRIARPPGGQVAMLGTNPWSVAAPAGGNHPFVLDMSTTAAPTGRIRQAARAGDRIPTGWLADDQGNAVTDPAALDRGDAHLQWLGAGSGSGPYKGFGLGLMVEILAALVPGAGLGPAPEALDGDGGPSGRDDDIGFLVAALAPGALRPQEDVDQDARTLFDTLLACPPAGGQELARYPGWHEAERAHDNRRRGVPLAEPLYTELWDLARTCGVKIPVPKGRR